MAPTQRSTRLPLLLGALLLAFFASPAAAQWLPFGTPVTTAVGNQDQVSVATDGAGGMIVAWRDRRTDAGDIYVQRLTATGLALWAPGGVAVCIAANEQRLPQIVTDGAGGAILAWQDNRVDPLGDMYAQRVDPNGAPLWFPNGVPLVTGASENVQTVSRFRMIPDGVGGATFTFCDNRLAIGGFHPGVPKVWGQRVTAFGSPLWSPGGVPIAAGPRSYENASLAPDGYGGIIVAWSDDDVGDWNIGAQRLNAAGVPQWGGGIVLCSIAGEQLHPEVVTDGSGGAIVAWQDNRVDPSGDIFAQRVDAAGNALWTPDGNPMITGASANNAGEYIIRMILDGGAGVTMAFSDDRKEAGVPDPGLGKVWAQRMDLNGTPLWGNGRPVAAGSGIYTWHRIVTDTEGGSIVVWQDGTTTTNLNIFAQRFDATGAPLWGPGVSVCNALGNQTAPAAIADGLGGVLSAWTDARIAATDIYAQVVDLAGVPMSNARWVCNSWTPNGAKVVAGPNLQSDPAAASDGAGGAIVAWRDERADTGDVYVQRMSKLGVPLWLGTGVPVCVQPGLQREPRVVSDGIGGAIVLWQDNRFDPAGDLYAQRFDAGGNALWAANGVPIVTGPSSNVQSISTFRVVADGVGGVILTFQDTRRPDGVVIGIPHVWAQRVNGFGSPLWGNGVPVSTISGTQSHGAPVSDGAGGIIVTWAQSGDIRGQRLISDGTMLWGAAVVICSAVGTQAFPDITSDGAGGAIVSWVDFRVDPNGDVFAQKLNPLGGAVWMANGIAQVTGASGNAISGLEDHIRLIPDNAGGAFIAFLDNRDAGGVIGAGGKIWGQQAKSSGSPGWGPSGVPVGANDISNFFHAIVTDGEGGSAIVWQAFKPPDWNIKAQRMSGGGSGYWFPGGIPVCDLPADQTRPAVTVDGRGHAIAAWTDARSDAGDIYAQRICVANRISTGVAVVPVTPAALHLAAPVPNPVESSTSYRITVAKPERVRVVMADVQGRIVEVLLDRHLDAGTYSYAWSKKGSAMAAGVYFLRVQTADAAVTRKLVIVP